MEAPEAKPKRRPRISLLSLLLIMALVASSITTAMLWREVDPLRSEVLRLRAETGALTVADPKKIYAIAIPTMEEDTWKWRIHLPEGHDFRIETTLRQIAGRTSAMSRAEWFAACGANCATSVEPGEFTLTIKLEHDPTHPNGKGHWNVRTKTQRPAKGNITTFGGGVCGTLIHWLSDGRSRSSSGDVRVCDPQVEFGAGEGLELLTLRRCEITEVPNGWSVTPPNSTKDSEGIAVRIVAR